MSYRTLSVGDKAVGSQDNIPLSISDFIEGQPSDGDIAKKNTTGWEASPSPIPGEVILPEASYVLHPTNNLHSTYTFPYSTTYWAFNWPRSIVKRYVYGGSTYINVDRPPSYLFSHNTWSCGVTLTAGTYLIHAIPTQVGGPITWGLYHTPVDVLSGGVYFGNRVTIKTGDGKSSNVLIGHLEISETRDVYIKVISGSSTYANANTFQSTFLNVRRLS